VSRTPRIHVMGLRQKFRNIHVVLSQPPTAAIGKATLCGVQNPGTMIPIQ
jgi:hypothetical protein